MKFNLTEDLIIENVRLQFVEGAILFRRADGWKLLARIDEDKGSTIYEHCFTLHFQRTKIWEARR